MKLLVLLTLTSYTLSLMSLEGHELFLTTKDQDTMEEVTENATAEFEELEAQINSFNEKLTVMWTENRSLETEVQDLIKEQNKLHYETTELDFELKNLNSEIAEQEEANNQLRMSIEASQSAGSDKEDLLAEMEDKLAELKVLL